MHRASQQQQQQQQYQVPKPQPAIGHHPPGQHPMQQRTAPPPPQQQQQQQQRYGTQQQPYGAAPYGAYPSAPPQPYAYGGYPSAPPPPQQQYPGYAPAAAGPQYGYAPPPPGYGGGAGGYPQGAYLPPMPDPMVPEVDYSKMPVSNAVQALVDVALQQKSNLAMLRGTVDELAGQLHQVMDKMNALEANGALNPILAVAEPTK